MSIVLDGSTGISSIGTLTGVTSISSAAADTPVILQDSSSNSNTCRAWVNFNGTSTVAIRADFNVTSITDNGTGSYTVNLTTAMPDTNYCVVAGGSSATPADARQGPGVSNSSTSAVAVYCGFDNGAGTDWIWVNVAIFR